MRREVTPGAAETLHVVGMGVPETLRNQLVQRLAQDLVARPAEDLLGGAVVQDDFLPLVHGDDGVHGRVEQPGQERRRVVGIAAQGGGIEAVEGRKGHDSV